MTDEQLAVLHERLDRFEARQERIAEGLGSCVDALEKIDELFVEFTDGMRRLPDGLSRNIATSMVELLGPRTLNGAIARRHRR